MGLWPTVAVIVLLLFGFGELLRRDSVSVYNDLWQSMGVLKFIDIAIYIVSTFEACVMDAAAANYYSSIIIRIHTYYHISSHNDVLIHSLFYSYKLVSIYANVFTHT